MKLLPIVCLCLAISVACSQPAGTMVFRKEYHRIPFPVRVENSGVYCIASFEVAGGTIRLAGYDDSGVYEYDAARPEGEPARTTRESLLGKKSFAGNAVTSYRGVEGTLENDNEEKILVAVSNPSTVVVSHSSGLRSFSILLSDRVACADLVGIDREGNTCLLVEYYVRQVPLLVRREIVTVSAQGEVVARLGVPLAKYCTTMKDFDIDADGNVYQLITDQLEVKVVRWNPMANGPGVLPSGSGNGIHFNDVVPISEPLGEMVIDPTLTASRHLSLRIAESYVVHPYQCSAVNLAPSDVMAPDGDIVRTPGWLVTGPNVRVPYKWGGFSTLAQYDAGLGSGKFAGDINTQGVSSSAVGVDCSGFVSRCWQLGSHYSTSMMPGITGVYTSWDELKPGDAVHKVGHVRLFVERAPNGALRIAEASGRDWSVNYWSYLASDLSGYSPRFYIGMGDDYVDRRPVITRVVPGSPGNVTVAWRADTSEVSAFRLYESIDGSNWTIVREQPAGDGCFAEVPGGTGPAYFRVSALARLPGQGEGLLSNALGIAGPGTGFRVLVIDGFERDNGSWRGPGNTFVVRYGQALAAGGAEFHSVQASELGVGGIRLSSYDAVFWMLGDESTASTTLTPTEQGLVIGYLEQGGKLFLSGSEIGYDLVEKGSSGDQAFYTAYLKAQYRSDNAASRSASGQMEGIYGGVNLVFGQVYAEDYPDELEGLGGALTCFRYGNQKGAGVQYDGIFGAGRTPGRLVYLGFPLESTADDSAFSRVIGRTAAYFRMPVVAVREADGLPPAYSLEQNYPNPFNSETVVGYRLAVASQVKLAVYDLLGRQVAMLADGRFPPGRYELGFKADRLSSGTYYYRLEAGAFTAGRFMIVLR